MHRFGPLLPVLFDSPLSIQFLFKEKTAATWLVQQQLNLKAPNVTAAAFMGCAPNFHTRKPPTTAFHPWNGISGTQEIACFEGESTIGSNLQNRGRMGNSYANGRMYQHTFDQCGPVF